MKKATPSLLKIAQNHYTAFWEDYAGYVPTLKEVIMCLLFSFVFCFFFFVFLFFVY